MASIEDYIFSDIGYTSNMHGELGLINIPSSRISEAGTLKLHLSNSEPINSLIISANPYDWMHVALRYTDINTKLYSQYESFSGRQTYKDKSFNLKIKLIEETESFPELSIGFRDFIGTGLNSGEYIVTSKKIGDFDLSVGLGWGSLSDVDGIDNPFIDLNQSFRNRRIEASGRGGMIEYGKWFSGRKASAFYGFEYVNKYSGLRFKFDYDRSNSFSIYRKSDYAFGLAIPASDLIDINIYRHRGADIGFGISYKSNYSKGLIEKSEVVNKIIFSESDQLLLKDNDDVFFGTMITLLNNYGLYIQEISLDESNLVLVIDQIKYRNQNVSTKRIFQLTDTLLKIRNINNVSIIYENLNVKTNVVSFPVQKFRNFLDNSLSLNELKRYLVVENPKYYLNEDPNFIGKPNFPSYAWGLSPKLTNHVGSPEVFYSGGIGLSFDQNIGFDKQSFMDLSMSFNLSNNLDKLRLKPYSRLPKVRSNIRSYMKEGKNGISRLSFTHITKPVYLNNGIFVAGFTGGIFEQMFGGAGSEILFKDFTKPWTITGNFYWVKQRDFNQRFTFRNYETFTGHLNFIWDTPSPGLKLILSGGRYLAQDSGITVNLSKTFKSGFTLGFFATKTDISIEEFGEGSFDKGIYFAIPIDLVSRNYQENTAKFLWRNLTRDGGAMLNGGLNLHSLTENKSIDLLNYFEEGFYE